MGPGPFEAALKQPSVRFAVAGECVHKYVIRKFRAGGRLIPEAATDEALEMIPDVLLVE